MDIRQSWRARFVVSVAIAAASSGCDPVQDAPTSTQDGPTFLTVLRAAVQPSIPDDGVAVVIQARGGSHVRLVTHGGTHRYAQDDGPATSSCAELPGTEPLYVLVAPNAYDCVVEARLYADCDPNDGGSALAMCAAESADFVTSTLLPLSVPRLGDARAAEGGSPSDGSVRDAEAETSRVTSRPAPDAPIDATTADARGDQ